MSDLEQYVNGIRRFGRITRERELELARIVQKARKPEKIRAAVEELVNSNLMLVVSRAIKMTRRFAFLHIDVMDFVSEGNVALLKAAETYEGGHESNAAFGTYAVKIIDYKMLLVLKSDAFIHVPANFFSCKKRFDQLVEENGGELEDKKVMEEMGITKDTLEVLKRGNAHRVTHLEEAYADEEGKSNWQEAIEDENAVKPSEEVSKGDALSFMMRYVDQLKPNEKTIIIEKELNERHLTYDELSAMIGISRERIRQIHYGALRKLKRMMMIDWQAEFGKMKIEKEPAYPYFGMRFGHQEKQALDQYLKESQRVREGNDRNAFKKISSW